MQKHTISLVVPYIGTWIETCIICRKRKANAVVPYIGTWIETATKQGDLPELRSYLI